MMKKVTLLAIMLLVTNIHAVQVVRIINGSHRFIKIFYDESDQNQFIIINPKSDELFHFNWPIRAKIEVVYEDKTKKGTLIRLVMKLTNIDDIQFVCAKSKIFQIGHLVKDVLGTGSLIISQKNNAVMLCIGEDGVISLASL